MHWPVFKVRPETFTWAQVRKIREIARPHRTELAPDSLNRTERTPNRQWWYMHTDGRFIAQLGNYGTLDHVPTLRADVVKRIFKLN